MFFKALQSLPLMMSPSQLLNSANVTATTRIVSFTSKILKYFTFMLYTLSTKILKRLPLIHNLLTFQFLWQLIYEGIPHM